jgi:hypothetical protein
MRAMTYQVLGLEALREKSQAPGRASFVRQLESALNEMEREGFTLVHYHHDPDPDLGRPDWFLFHAPGAAPKGEES